MLTFDQPHLLAGGVAGALSIAAAWLAAPLVRREARRTDLRMAVLALPMAGAAIWAARVMPSGWLMLATVLLGWTLCVLAAIDLRAFRLPDMFTFPLIGVGLVLSLGLPDRDPLAHAIGAAAGFLAFYAIAVLYDRLRGREGLGLGDAKLAAAAGAWLGWQPLPSVVLIACAAALIWIAGAVAIRGKSAAGEQIAFGVPLCLAFWLVWLYGAPL